MTNDSQSESAGVVSSTAWVDRALETLKNRGPMKIRPLASAIGHPNPRSLSMLLQWSKGRAKQECNRWHIAVYPVKCETSEPKTTEQERQAMSETTNKKGIQ